jgi:hypothetical protein
MKILKLVVNMICGRHQPVDIILTAKAKDYTYASFKKVGWTDEQLIEHGYAERRTFDA